MIAVATLSTLISWIAATSSWAQVIPDPTPTPSARIRKVPFEKEAEGTRATHRFNKDPVIKSQYEHEGTTLEVDPD